VIPSPINGLRTAAIRPCSAVDGYACRARALAMPPYGYFRRDAPCNPPAKMIETLTEAATRLASISGIGLTGSFVCAARGLIEGRPPPPSNGGCGWRRSIAAPIGPNRGNSDVAICGFRVAYSGAIKIRGSGHASEPNQSALIQTLKTRDIGIFCFSFVRCGLATWCAATFCGSFERRRPIYLIQII
jgi:hypothetical protein